MSEEEESSDVQEAHSQQKNTEEEAESSISFNPPVYRQRYQVVSEMVKKYEAKKVLDFGCAEAKLLRALIRNDTIKMECLVGVDIDGELLKENARMIDPLLCDWLNIRETPFTVSMFQGSISEADDRFCDFDLISCVEIIEHLIPEHLEKMPAVVFGQLSPKVVIVTTPNADFNVLFPNLEGFRHWDHKFEWTRQEFEKWSSCQASKYGYNVTFQGIGEGPEGTDHLGCCSQMALFEKKELCQVKEKESFGQPYQLIKQVEYPHRKSTISQEQKIIYEVERLLWFLSQPNSYEEEEINEDSYDDENRTKSYDLTQLFDMGRLKELCGTIENLR
ncbi:small RNA 2'-O-methyltransferase isoform X2 [Exaiptasia diaphana]|uniref:Small RNA 2'-O-methyltransferase n=1 Tax=Exaiptasia diaphana TaxID=2652724 RepID=A0A913YLG0_EXADI|nr:small RNA 2'-O-methyltransferase isoform X2 [Exaiptasia diaphana]